jgi:3-deoxy-D-manno-oct-2-ulosonic acid (Kdo) hydroxylase
MLKSYSVAQLKGTDRYELSDALEQGHIVNFPETPFPLPTKEEIHLLLVELPKRIRLKNVSYHPEVDSVLGMKAEPQLKADVTRILKTYSSHVQDFLKRTAPGLVPDWQVATCSFRPIQELGRNLKPHASNELIHVDAGAYGATHGQRILRFFTNMHPEQSRIWKSKGPFSDLFPRFREAAGMSRQQMQGRLEPGAAERLYSSAVRGMARGVPLMRFLDTSPYDRAMRQFHNYMKDNPSFRDNPEGVETYEFKPGCSWMVYTDGVSHAVASGQFAFVQTFLIPYKNNRQQQLVPLNVIKGSAA